MKRTLTETREDYLRAIYYLEEKLGRTAKSVEIAKHLNLSRSTVAERLLAMSRDNLTEHSKYGGVALTKNGAKIAQRLMFKHRLIEVFLHDMLKRPLAEVHDEAHKLEHAFSEESIQALNKLLGEPKIDPHGSPINS